MNEVNWSSFVYFLTIAVNVFCEETSAVLLTPNKMEYTFFPLASTVLKFKVRAPHNAHILLSGGPKDENPTYEVFLGGWMNTRSAIRFNHTRPDKAAANTTGILSAGELRGFWVNCSQGFVGIGREGELIPFLKWTNRKPFKVQYFGVRTGWGATGEWIIDDSNVTYARVDLYDFHIGQPGIVSVDVLSTTQPFLVWKVHNKTFSESSFDPTGRYHATKALLKRDSEWQAKLVISNVSLEDTQEEILLTARNRSKLGAKTYHVFLYAFNATFNYTDDLSGNEGNESSAIDSSALTDGPILWSTRMTSERNTSNKSTQTKFIEKITSSPAMKLLTATPKIMKKITTPTQTPTSLTRTTLSIVSRTTTPKSISTVNVSYNTTKYITIAVPRNIVNNTTEPITKLQTRIPNKTYNPSFYSKTVSDKTSNYTTHPTRFLGGKFQNGTNKLATKIINSTSGYRMPTSTTAVGVLQSKGLKCPDYANAAKYLVVIGVLCSALIVSTAFVVYIMIRHKHMNGQWGFTVKCQVPIPMENLYADDNGCLIEQPDSIYLRR